MPLGDPAVPSSPPANDAVTPAKEGARAAGPIWTDPILIVAVVLWVGTLAMLRSVDHTHTLPTVHVVSGGRIAAPGASVELVAHVERHRADGRHEHEGIEVDLRLATEAPTTGIVRTDATGIARRTVVAPTEPGAIPIAVDVVGSYADGSGLRFDPALTVIEPGAPWVLCEVDTIVPALGANGNGTEGGGSKSSGKKGEPPIVASRAAVNTLQGLSAGRAIVYLFLGAAEETDELRRALRLGGAPFGAVIADRGPEEGIDDYRARVVAQWSQGDGSGGVEAPAAVVTRSPNGCFVYRAADLATIVFEASPCEGAVHADSWVTAGKIIAELAPVD